MNRVNLFLFFLCVSLSGAGAWLASRYGHCLDFLDKPNTRSSHSQTTPKGGGIGILAGFIAAAFFLRLSAFFWMPPVLLSIISLIGDRYNLSPILRLFFQGAASFIFLWGLWHFQSFSSFGYLMLIPLMLYMVGTANCYNFMDGINGIAGITGIVGFSLLAFFGTYSGIYPAETLMNIAIVFCCLGFIPFNMPKAKVFMGDVGSIFLGFLFGGMVVLFSKSLLDFICLASFLFPFYADELTTMAVRIKDRENLFSPHRRHIYQLLANEMGIPHWQVSIGYGLLQIIVGASVLMVMDKGLIAVFSLLLFFSLTFSIASWFIRSAAAESVRISLVQG